MSRFLNVKFDLVTPECLRMLVSDPTEGMLSLADADPRADGACAVFQADPDMTGGQNTLSVTANFPLDPGRKSSAKAICKCAVDAAKGAA